MTEQTLNTPTSQEDLTAQISAAVASGNHSELDRLMTVEIPEDTTTDTVEEQEEEVTTDEPVKDDVPEDKTSDDGTVEEKDEAADTAASKPEDVKQEDDELVRLRKELHALKSDAGRVPFMQRRQQELERELRELKLSRKAEEATAVKSNDKPQELPENLKKKIAALRDIDPDLADTLEEGFKASLGNKGSTADAANVAKEMVQDYARMEEQRKEDEFLHEQFSILVERIPQAPQIFKSQEWKDWKAGLSPGRKAMAESNFADDVQIAISAFVQDMQARFGTGATKTTEAPATKQPTAEETAEASKVREQRERKLATSGEAKTVASKGSKPPLNEEELFKAEYNRIRKELNL